MRDDSLTADQKMDRILALRNTTKKSAKRATPADEGGLYPV
jgi:hypothetical protein